METAKAAEAAQYEAETVAAATPYRQAISTLADQCERAHYQWGVLRERLDGFVSPEPALTAANVGPDNPGGSKAVAEVMHLAGKLSDLADAIGATTRNLDV